MLYFFIFIALNAVMIRAMDVDTEPVTKTTMHVEEPAVDATTSSSASSALTDTFIVTEKQKQQ